MLKQATLRKTASWFDVLMAGGETATDSTKAVFATALAMSGLAGVMTGYGLSRATSPGEQEEKNYQKEYLLTAMKTKVARYKRDKELEGSTIDPSEQPKSRRDVVLG